jgi:hypothetical protein
MFAGEFRNGKIQGQGTAIYTNGIMYVGEHRDGSFHGQGILTFPDGRPSLEGIWDSSRFVSAQRIPDYIAGRASPTAPVVAQATPPVMVLSRSTSRRIAIPPL